jgi:hypothetical protein
MNFETGFACTFLEALLALLLAVVLPFVFKKFSSKKCGTT